MKYDLIIIGSGLGGLECAHMMARRGMSVLVLERQKHPGGCMQSYKRAGFDLDTGLHYVGGLDEGQQLHDAFQDLGLLSLPWKRLAPEAFDLVTIGGKTFPFAEGYTCFAERLAEYFPHERDALKAYVHMLETADMKYGVDINAWDYLHETFSDELLINVLSGTSLKSELRKETLPLFSFAHNNSSFIESSWRLCGGGNLIVDSLVNDIRSFGGDVLCKAEVVELVEKDGRITEAVCENGEHYEADHFICDIHPAIMLSLIKESSKIKNMYRRRITSSENTFGTFTVSLTLKEGVLRYFNHNKYIYKEANVWTFHEKNRPVGGVLVSCRVPEDGSEYARQIDILTPMTWEQCLPWENTTKGKRGDDYLCLKEQLAAECIALAETEIPGLSAMVEKSFTSSPLTYRDYNHTPEGSSYGMRKDFSNPLFTILSPQTPVSNLLMTGQNLVLHGLHGVTMTARLTCEQLITNSSFFLRKRLRDNASAQLDRL